MNDGRCQSVFPAEKNCRRRSIRPRSPHYFQLVNLFYLKDFWPKIHSFSESWANSRILWLMLLSIQDLNDYVRSESSSQGNNHLANQGSSYAGNWEKNNWIYRKLRVLANLILPPNSHPSEPLPSPTPVDNGNPLFLLQLIYLVALNLSLN